MGLFHRKKPAEEKVDIGKEIKVFAERLRFEVTNAGQKEELPSIIARLQQVSGEIPENPRSGLEEDYISNLKITVKHLGESTGEYAFFYAKALVDLFEFAPWEREGSDLEHFDITLWARYFVGCEQCHQSEYEIAQLKIRGQKLLTLSKEGRISTQELMSQGQNLKSQTQMLMTKLENENRVRVEYATILASAVGPKKQ